MDRGDLLPLGTDIKEDSQEQPDSVYYDVRVQG